MNPQDAALEISMFHASPISVISDCLRGFLIASPNHDLIAADFNAIESRVVNWLSGEDSVLDIFRSHGKIYEFTASNIYAVPIEAVTKDQRQIGKVAELALGFGGGKGAFLQMAKNYGVKVSEAKAEEIKLAFRESRPKLVQYWYKIERAAIAASRSTVGQIFKAGPPGREVQFKKAGSFLWCRLPSARVLCYPYPKVQLTETPWGEMKDQLTYMGEDSLTHKWERESTYGGKLTENVTQAVARDLLVEAMLRLEERGYPIVMHVHDEIVCEVKSGFGSIEEMEKIMEETPAWASGLPIKAAGWKGRRYQK